MDTNQEFDENAADFRNSQSILTGSANQPQIQQTVFPVSTGRRSVSKIEIGLAIGILVGFLMVIYFMLHRTSPQSAPPQLSPSTRPGTIK